MIPKEFFPTRDEPEIGGMTFLAVWTAIRRGWLWILAIVAASVLIAGAATMRQRKIFRSSATLEIDPAPSRPLGTDVQTVVDAAGSYWNNREYYETQLKVITSNNVLQEVVRRLQLNRDGAFLEQLPPSAAPKQANVPVEAAGAVLASRVSVEPVKNSRLVIVYLEDANPGRAQRVLSTLVDTYLDQNIDSAMTSANTSGEWLGKQLETLKTELENSELALYNYKKSNNILSLSLDDQSNMLRSEMGELNTHATQVRARIEQISARYKQLSAVDPEAPADIPVSELLASATLSALRQRYLQAQGTLGSQMAIGRGEQHPAALAAANEVALVRTALVQEIRNVQSSLEHDLAAARQEAGGLMGLFKAAEQRALDVNLLEIEYRKRQREKVNTERLYTLVLERTKEGELTRMMRFNNLRVVEAAVGPRSPIRPNLPTSLALGGVIGVLLGIAVAIGKERLDRSIKSGEGIEQLGVPFLGSLPEVGDHGGGRRYSYYGERRPPIRRPPTRRQREGAENEAPELVAHRQPASGVAEASRAIRTSIRFSSADRPYRCLLITSAVPAEGKTTVACCIAISMAQSGQRTLIVDCDLRRPRLHKIFGTGRDLGTADAILDTAQLDRAVVPTEVENLFLLPAGPYAPNPADLINSERFGKFIEELRARFDSVIIDSPPILPVTDSAILSTRVDGTVLVVRSGKTNKESIAKALRILGDVGGKLAGAILNGMSEGRQSGDYHYSYYGDAPQPAAQSPAA